MVTVTAILLSSLVVDVVEGNTIIVRNNFCSKCLLFELSYKLFIEMTCLKNVGFLTLNVVYLKAG